MIDLPREIGSSTYDRDIVDTSDIADYFSFLVQATLQQNEDLTRSYERGRRAFRILAIDDAKQIPSIKNDYHYTYTVTEPREKPQSGIIIAHPKIPTRGGHYPRENSRRHYLQPGEPAGVTLRRDIYPKGTVRWPILLSGEDIGPLRLEDLGDDLVIREFREDARKIVNGNPIKPSTDLLGGPESPVII